MRTLTLSAHRLDIAACPRRLWYYQEALGGRAPILPRAALVQGIAGHGYLALWRKGKPQEKQDAYVDAVFAAQPLEPTEYRTAAYLKEILLQYKAEWPELEEFDIEEVEQAGELSLGETATPSGEQVLARWAYRRDLVGVSRLDGKRYMISNKFVSQNRSDDVKALTNSRAEKGYWWAWQVEHPDKPLAGIIPRRCVIRKSTKDKRLNYELPLDNVITFQPWQIEEWRQDTLRLAAAIAARNPADPTQWPMETALCKGRPYGCCDYLDVCLLPPQDRLLKLSGDTFRGSAERQPWEALED